MIMAAVGLLASAFTLPETLAPLILSRKAAHIRRETQHWALHSKWDENPVTFDNLWSKYGLKPWKIMLLEPILVVATIYISLVYAILYLISSLSPTASSSIEAYRPECPLYHFWRSSLG